MVFCTVIKMHCHFERCHFLHVVFHAGSIVVYILRINDIEDELNIADEQPKSS